MKFVNVYEVTREYGGPEEGGWWYNRYDCIETYPTREDNTKTVKEYLENEYKGLEYGDIYSLRGGVEVQVLIEEKPKESQTTCKPIYE